MAKPKGDTPDVQTVVGMGAPPAPSRAPAPAKDLPDPGVSVLALQVDLSPNEAERASDAILGDSPRTAPPEPDEPEVFRSPVVFQQSPLRRAIDALDEFFSPPWTKNKAALLSGACGSLLGLLLVLLVRGPARAEQSTGLVAAGSASAMIASAHPAPIPRKALRITADGPIAKVAIGDRIVDQATPAPSVDVELLEAEKTKALRVLVTGTDGRTAMVTADPSVRGLDVSLDDEQPEVVELPPPPLPGASTAEPPQAHVSTAPVNAPAPAAPRETKRAWPKRTPRK